jgi:micrococcal nuclease
MQRLPAYILALLVLALVPAPACAQAPPTTRLRCEVSRISDGDSFRCRNGRRVRLTGIDSPELSQQPFGPYSRAALGRWLPLGATVDLELDVAPTDRYGRQLAYVWADTTLINEAMVRAGWAMLYTVAPNVKYAGRLERAQKQARASGAGLWAQRGFDCPPSEFRRNRCAAIRP